MSCDICGSNKKAYLTEIEGARLYVCDMCNPTRAGRIRIERKVFTPRPRPNFTRTNPIGQNKGVENKEKRDFRPKKRFVKSFAPKRYKSFELNDYDLVENYGDVLKKAREEKKITIDDLAKNIREPVSFLIKIEQGKLKPNDKMLLKLYDYLGVNLVKSIDGEFEESAQDSKEQEEAENKIVEEFTSVTHNNKKKIVL